MGLLTFSLKLASDILDNAFQVKAKKCHATASGVRMVVSYDFDPDHDYEILINPLEKKDA